MKRLSVTLLILSTFVIPAGLAQNPAMTDTPETMEYDDEEEEVVTQEEALEDMRTRLRRAQETEAASPAAYYATPEAVANPDQTRIQAQAQAQPGIAPAAPAVPASPRTAPAVAPAKDTAQAVTVKPKPAAATVIEKKSTSTQKHDWTFKNRKTSKTSEAPSASTTSKY